MEELPYTLYINNSYTQVYGLGSSTNNGYPLFILYVPEHLISVSFRVEQLGACGFNVVVYDNEIDMRQCWDHCVEGLYGAKRLPVTDIIENDNRRRVIEKYLCNWFKRDNR
jgi:hypothetical protein